MRVAKRWSTFLTSDLMKLAVENGILGKNQHSFRRGHSTLTALTEVIHEIGECIDEKGHIYIIFIDFRKAFDRTSHRKLLIISRFLDNTQVLNCIEACLSDIHFVRFRFQCQ